MQFRWKHGKCPVCDNEPITSFNWKLVNESKDTVLDDLNVLAEHIKSVEELKFGSLYRCELCGLNWVLDDNGIFMHRVSDNRTELLREWNSKGLMIPPAYLCVLDSIGGIATDIYEDIDIRIPSP